MTVGPDPGLGYAAPTSPRDVVQLSGDDATQREVILAEEVPVAIAYNRRPHVVMMCTPSDLEDLAVGFTVSEGIAAQADVGAIEMARHSRGVELSVSIPPDAMEALTSRQRAISGRTGCGLCGVEAIDEAVRPIRHVQSAVRVSAAALYRAGEELGARQTLNHDTHAIHAAGWATPDGALVVVREDVGRHNALDKTLGALLRQGIDPAGGFLVLTSRASLELVQKAAMCGVELLAAVSRPTGLAVRLAESSGMTLVGLLRGTSAAIYAHPERVPLDHDR